MSKTKIRINQTQIGYKDSAVAAENGISNPLTAAPDTVDGVTMVVGYRVMILGGSIQAGLWSVVTVGTGSNGVWERPEDSLDGDTLIPGTVVQINVGGQGHGGSMVYLGGNTVTARTVGLVVGTDSQQWFTQTAPDYLWNGAIIFAQPLVGTIDGSNKVFTTGNAVGGDAEIAVYLNGQVQVDGADYTKAIVSDDWEITFTFAPKAAPGNPDVVTASFQFHLTL
jgi:hypothetical protein